MFRTVCIYKSVYAPSVALVWMLLTTISATVLSPMITEKSHYGKLFMVLYTTSQVLGHACHDCVTFKPQTLFKHPLVLVRRVGVKIWEQLLIPHAPSSLQTQLHGSYSTNNGFGSQEPSCFLLPTYFPFDKAVLRLALSWKIQGSHHHPNNPDLTLGARTPQFCYSALISPLNFCFLYCCQPPNALFPMRYRKRQKYSCLRYTLWSPSRSSNRWKKLQEPMTHSHPGQVQNPRPGPTFSSAFSLLTKHLLWQLLYSPKPQTCIWDYLDQVYNILL